MRRLALLLPLVLGATTGCRLDPYCVECENEIDASTSDGGDAALVDGEVDAMADAEIIIRMDACVNPGIEVCDGLDNDCDGQIDEGNPQAGQVCSRNIGLCREGLTECVSGRLECMGGVNPMPEMCDGEDNDCDGMDDNGDPGGGPPCGIDTGECVRGQLHCTSGVLQCEGAVVAVNEICDGRDNNCDGWIDNGAPTMGACGISTGECAEGTLTCIGGGYACTGATGPKPEMCNSLDDDCDNVPDSSEFDFTTDVRNCGGCGMTCGSPDAKGALWKCEPGVGGAGTCKVRVCQNGFYNIDGMDFNGCEYACNFQGAETCNGVDDDCDNMIDESAELVTPPMSFCRQVGACSGARPECRGLLGWRCNYTTDVQVDAMGIPAGETRCDGLDNDCNGLADTDAYPLKNMACGNGSGICRNTMTPGGQPATFQCNGTMNGLVCNAGPALPGGTEVCDGADNDCDNMIDEGRSAPGTNASYVVEDMVRVNNNLYVYTYEASRPDAGVSSPGTRTNRSCSRANVLPWVNVTYGEALAACTAGGLRLCTEAEWQTACRGSSSCNWGMASCSTYNTTQCNGEDFDAVSGGGDDDALFATGSPTFASCTATHTAGSIRDMSGNVKEWTQQRSSGANPLRGGSFNNVAGGLRCDFDFTVADNTFKFGNVGFRCCSSSAP